MSLYHLAQSWQNLLDQMDDIPEDAFRDTLEAIEGEFDEKADNIACLIKSLDAEAEEIKKECESLKQRESAKRAKASRLREYLREQMEIIGRRKIETPRNCISVASSTPKVMLDDDFVRWAQESADYLLKYKPPEPDKSAIKQAIQDGADIPFARLESGVSLRIK